MKKILILVALVMVGLAGYALWPKSSMAPGGAELQWVEANGLRVGVGLMAAAPQVGDNQLAVAVERADGTPVADASVSAYGEMPAMGAMPSMRAPAELSPVGDGHWKGALDLPMRGEWPLTVEVQADGGASARLSFDMATGRSGLQLAGGGRPAAMSMASESMDDMTVAGPYRIDVSLPGGTPTTGDNRLRIELHSVDGEPVTDAEVRAVAQMPEMPGMGAVEVTDFRHTGGGVYEGTLSLSMAGDWVLAVDAETSAHGHGDRVLALTTGAAGLSPVSATPEGIAHYTCPMHSSVRSPEQGSCPICGMQLQPVTLADQKSGSISLDTDRRQLIGVTTAKAEWKLHWRQVRAVGEVMVDESRLADVSLKFDGWIGELRADTTGASVRQGETLFTVYGPDLLAAQEEYLEAVRRNPSGALARAARSRLRLLDMPDELIREIARKGAAMEYVPIRSPIDGVVIDKPVVAGSAMRASSRLLRIADLSTVWVEAEVYEQDLDWVRVGMPATVRFPNLPGEELEATVDFVYPTLDGMSRTGRVRLALPNADGRLKPEMYAEVRLVARFGRRLVVPEEAVIFAGDTRVVFVDAGDGRLEPRRVRIGLRSDDAIEILDGVAAGESVGTSGNFLIASETRLKTGIKQW